MGKQTVTDKYTKLLKDDSAYARIFKEGKQINVKVTRKSLGTIRTAYGNFYIYHFDVNDKWKEYTVILTGDIDESMKPVFNIDCLLLRIDSACTTGQIFGDITCDCNYQLKSALVAIAKKGYGMVIRIDRQDGRGMGMDFKLVTLLMQNDLKCSTVTAFDQLAGKLDDRDYYGVVAILQYLGAPKAISLITNNPLKFKELEENGYSVTRVEIRAHVTDENRLHLVAKRKYMGHIISV